MKKFVPILALFLAGCGSPGTGQRVAFDSLGVVGGGSAAYFAGGKDPALTTAGAVGGFVVSEALQTIAKSGRRKAFNSGVEEGKAIGQEQILHGLWEESNGLRGKSGTSGQPLTVPAREQNGVLYDAHAAPTVVPAGTPEKIRVPAVSTRQGALYPHYETFQKENP